MVCFRRSKNLKDHLVRSKLRREEETVVGMFKVPISLVGSLRIWKEHIKLVSRFFNLFDLVQYFPR
jgi:hypothetical protein